MPEEQTTLKAKLRFLALVNCATAGELETAQIVMVAPARNDRPMRGSLWTNSARSTETVVTSVRHTRIVCRRPRRCPMIPAGTVPAMLPNAIALVTKPRIFS
jgi:hypothetical protein